MVRVATAGLGCGLSVAWMDDDCAWCSLQWGGAVYGYGTVRIGDSNTLSNNSAGSVRVATAGLGRGLSAVFVVTVRGSVCRLEARCVAAL